MPKHPNKEEPQLVGLLRQLAPVERTELIHRLGVTRPTFYRWQNRVGDIPWDAVNTIKHFLDQTLGGDHDMNQLRQPVKAVRAKTVA